MTIPGGERERVEPLVSWCFLAVPKSNPALAGLKPKAPPLAGEGAKPSLTRVCLCRTQKLKLAVRIAVHAAKVDALIAPRHTGNLLNPCGTEKPKSPMMKDCDKRSVLETGTDRKRARLTIDKRNPSNYQYLIWCVPIRVESSLA